MEWIKIPTDEILLPKRSDWQNYALIKYIALYCQLEEEPNEFQLRRFLTQKQFNFVQKEKQIVLKIVKNCIENVSKKRMRDKLHYDKKSLKNNDDFKIPLAERQLSASTDKIREDNNNNPPLISPPYGGDRIKKKEVKKKEEVLIPDEMKEAMELWLAYRKEIGKSYKPIGLRGCIKNLEDISSNNRDIAIAIVKQSIANGWTGLFPLKDIKIEKKESSLYGYSGDLVIQKLKEIEMKGLKNEYSN